MILILNERSVRIETKSSRLLNNPLVEYNGKNARYKRYTYSDKES
jgi:hypothetical protein